MQTPNPISSAVIAGLAVGLLLEWLRTAVQAAPPRGQEMIVQASVAQVPVPQVAQELEAFVRAGVADLEDGRDLADVLEKGSALGAHRYAYSLSRESETTGLRIWGGPSLLSPRSTSSDAELPSGERGTPEGLAAREIVVWSALGAEGGGWCAYLEQRGTLGLTSEYVYVQVAPSRQIFLSSGFRV
jgi:hypothetical protein